MPFVSEDQNSAAPSPTLRSGGFEAHFDPAFEERVDAALQFLASHLAVTGRPRNKPVMMHCMRVGYYLRDLQCSHDVVIAGILHDVLEATRVGPRVVETMFGKNVRRLVEANTVERGRGSWHERFRDSLKRCEKIGIEAIMVRAADVLDNANRHNRLGNHEKLARQTEKLESLIRALEPHRASAPASQIYKDISSYWATLMLKTIAP